MGKVVERLTFANVVSVIALFAALGLGTAWAATSLKKNEVNSRIIKDGSVKTRDLAKDAVTSPKVANGSLRAEDFAPGQLPAGPQGKTGVDGAPGPQGKAGAEGAPGPTASSAASADPNPDTAINPASFSALLSTTVTTTASSRVIGNASIEVQPAFGTPSVACQIKIDGAFVGEFEQARLSSTAGAGVIISMSQGAVVSAGSHVVAIACQQTVGAAGAVFSAGNITAIAAAA